MTYQKRVRFTGPKSMLHRVEFGGAWETRLTKRIQKEEQANEAEGRHEEEPAEQAAAKSVREHG